MSSFIPITLVGDNLGNRHQHLNCLVNEAFLQNVPFQTVRDLPEQSPIDRLFKIGLAAKHKDFDYIVTTLKDDDMLYVSRALKCLWLLEPQHSHVINPSYLEDVLFPEMTSPAVNKMKHWLQLHLKDTQRCEQFYVYYSKTNFTTAIRFLWHCSGDFILNEFLNISHRLTPQYLKRLSEKCPQVTKIYYDLLQNNDTILSSYIENDEFYYATLKYLLKTNTELVLDIIEKYFTYEMYGPLSPVATKYIMKKHKNRFLMKPELYTTWLLDRKTLAKYLSSDEIKEVVLKLARTEHLKSWFSYKAVEPLIKRLELQERTSFKKQVFVDKCVGETVTEWPYEVPSSPEVIKDRKTHVFMDKEYKPEEYYSMGLQEKRPFIRMCTGGGGEVGKMIIPKETLLNTLFNQYRVASFEHTLFMLRKQMAAESSPKNRKYIMLVLVSKSGGRAEALETLLQLLVARHANEPPTLRAAVVRSLVRRAFAWRLPPAVWDLLLQFGRDLGLDGRTPVADCSEGLHAVILRNLLLNNEIEPGVFDAFLNDFTSFKEYSLTAAECRCVCERLPTLLLAAAELKPDAVHERLGLLLDLLDAHYLRVDECPGVVPAIVAAARRDPIATRPLLQRVYDARVARRELFRENFEFMRSDASFVNVLRHDTRLLGTGEVLEAALVKCVVSHERFERFLRKLRLYFGEVDGLAARYLAVLERAAAAEPHLSLARPLALLGGTVLAARLRELDAAGDAYKRLAAALRANAHAARPPLDLAAFGWRAAGAKAVANRVLVCRATELRRHVQALLTWRRTARLSLSLSLRAGDEVATFAAVAALRPAAAVRLALRYFLRRGEVIDPRVWDAVKPAVLSLDFFTKDREYLRCVLIDNAHLIPSSIKAEYCTVVFEKIWTVSKVEALPILTCLESLLPDLDETFVRNTIRNYINDELDPDRFLCYESYSAKWSYRHVRIIAKFLLLSKCETVQANVLETICEPFLSRMEILWNSLNDKRPFLALLKTFISTLKYSIVFFDSKYISCLPVFEKTIVWMQKLLPLEKWFELYTTIHLTMLYFKSIRQSVKQRPDVFEVEKRKLNEGVEIVGTVFGKYIASEVDELMRKYFTSIREMYATELLSYLNKYFYIDSSRKLFTKSMIRGIVDGSHENESHLLAEYVVENEAKCSGFDKSDKEEILGSIMETKRQDIIFFIYASEWMQEA